MPKKSVKAQEQAEPKEGPPRVTRSQTLIDLMRVDGGASVEMLAEAVGWQVHSVRGFIAGQLKKRPDLTVTKTKVERVTRYQVADAK